MKQCGGAKSRANDAIAQTCKEWGEQMHTIRTDVSNDMKKAGRVGKRMAKFQRAMAHMLQEQLRCKVPQLSMDDEVEVADAEKETCGVGFVQLGPMLDKLESQVSLGGFRGWWNI